MWLIGVCNLVVEVNAKHIKGMLGNSDIAPSASINCWILSILTFHFTLVHIPGTMHGPDGLLRHPQQPNDEDKPKDDFDDWIDQVHGFMHHINCTTQSRHGPQRLLAFTSSIVVSGHSSASAPASSNGLNPSDLLASYDIVPWTTKSRAADGHLSVVRQWHRDLLRPDGLSDKEYLSFM